MEREVHKVILEIAEEFNEHQKGNIRLDLGANAPLYGKEGALDSLGFVSFVLAVEQALQEKLQLPVTLSDEKAMSQKNSPFRTIGSLTEYVCRLVKEHGRE